MGVQRTADIQLLYLSEAVVMEYCLFHLPRTKYQIRRSYCQRLIDLEDYDIIVVMYLSGECGDL